MSNVRTLVFQLIRTYASKPFTKAAGIRGKHKIDLPDDPEEINHEDLDAYTSDFMNIAQSHKMHKREMEKAKEKLKQRIVKSKYFKEVEPKFLTFMEKNQIQKLHESDPEEWTPETLSKSFPALPETIRSILKAKWVPKSIDRIVKFDTEVVNNWKNFKRGRLVVNPILHEHLMKFKDRKIALPTREELSKTLLLPKVVFQKPRSTIFSNILKNTMKEKQPVHEQKLISSESEINRNKKTLFTINKDDLEKSMVQVNNSDCMKTYKRKPVANRRILSFNEFMKLELTKLYKKCPEEGITLLQTYRKYIESANLEVVQSEEPTNLEAVKSEESTNLEGVKSEESTNLEVVQSEESTNLEVVQSEESTNLEVVQSEESFDSVKRVNKENIIPTKNVPVVEQNETQTKVVSALNTERSSGLDTYVKDRKTDIDTNFEYTNPIKIPKNVWKQGMTYRVKDCYYDDDGEFLYRVPGLRL